MIDPKYITNYHRNDAELEEFAIFTVCVAGKNAHTTARAVDKLVKQLLSCYKEMTLPYDAIFQIVFDTGLAGFSRLIKDCGIGCYNIKAATLYELSKKIVDNPDFLKSCKVTDLESILGIGSKTARFFLLHSRTNQRVCAVDTHILKHLRAIGFPDVPSSTPLKGSKNYTRLENGFLDWCDQNGHTNYAEADLANWNKYSLDGLENRATLLVAMGETNGTITTTKKST